MIELIKKYRFLWFGILEEPKLYPKGTLLFTCPSCSRHFAFTPQEKVLTHCTECKQELRSGW